MVLPQFVQLEAFALEYRPDLILELGRGRGNSTCAFTEAANQLNSAEGSESKCRVISLCRSPSWEQDRPPGIAALMPDEWFQPLSTLRGDILDFDYPSLLSGARRVLLFWDAHGYDVAECVLAVILPLLVDREHVVIMHDINDARYEGPVATEYGERYLWRGNDHTGQSRVRLGNIDSVVEQAVAIVDFASRNNLVLHSADESFATENANDVKKSAELQEMLGHKLLNAKAHWLWFSLNEVLGPKTFPKCRPRGQAKPG
jgi:hypothetical protein